VRRIAVLDAPSNLGLRPPTVTSVPGCAKAPGALRDQGLLTRLGARDAGCLTPPRYDPGDWRPGDGVAHATEIAAYSRALADRIGAIIDGGEFPVILGGDCSILIGAGIAMHRLGDAVGGRIGLVFVDGHSDFRHPGNASYVGAAAGEDLALVTGRGQANLAAIESRRPYFRDIDVVVLGIRAQDEYRLDLQAAGIVTRPVPALRAEGAARSAQWARDQLVDCAGYWVHVDVDVLDPAVMPAVDAPDPGGIAFPELELLLAGLVESPHCLGVEITVFDPDYDPDGRYAAEITSAVVSGLSPVRSTAPRPDLAAARRDLDKPARRKLGKLTAPDPTAPALAVAASGVAVSDVAVSAVPASDVAASDVAASAGSGPAVPDPAASDSAGSDAAASDPVAPDSAAPDPAVVPEPASATPAPGLDTPATASASAAASGDRPSAAVAESSAAPDRDAPLSGVDPAAGDPVPVAGPAPVPPTLGRPRNESRLGSRRASGDPIAAVISSWVHDSRATGAFRDSGISTVPVHAEAAPVHAEAAPVHAEEASVSAEAVPAAWDAVPSGAPVSGGAAVSDDATSEDTDAGTDAAEPGPGATPVAPGHSGGSATPGVTTTEGESASVENGLSAADAEFLLAAAIAASGALAPDTGGEADAQSTDQADDVSAGPVSANGTDPDIMDVAEPSRPNRVVLDLVGLIVSDAADSDEAGSEPGQEAGVPVGGQEAGGPGQDAEWPAREAEGEDLEATGEKLESAGGEPETAGEDEDDPRPERTRPEPDTAEVRMLSRPLGSAPLLDSEPLPATRPGMLRPRPPADGTFGPPAAGPGSFTGFPPGVV
jgi:arginase family enzyme